MPTSHWHLVRTDWDRSDAQRFSTERARTERNRATHGVAHEPAEVAEWLIGEALRAAQDCPSTEDMLVSSGMDTPEGVELAREVYARAAGFGRDVATMMGLGSLRIAHLNAYAMTDTECPRHALAGSST